MLFQEPNKAVIDNMRKPLAVKCQFENLVLVTAVWLTMRCPDCSTLVLLSGDGYSYGMRSEMDAFGIFNLHYPKMGLWASKVVTFAHLQDLGPVQL